MRPEVDVSDGVSEQREYAALDAGSVADQRKDRSVVRRIGGMVEQAHAADVSQGLSHARDDLCPAALAHVGNAFD